MYCSGGLFRQAATVFPPGINSLTGMPTLYPERDVSHSQFSILKPYAYQKLPLMALPADGGTAKVDKGAGNRSKIPNPVQKLQKVIALKDQMCFLKKNSLGEISESERLKS